MAQRRRKSLSEIEENDWGIPNGASTGLVARVHTLRHVPIGELTAGDLRALINQQVGLVWLVPLALDLLEVNPCVEGDFYRGDLRAAVAHVDQVHWDRNGDQAERFSAIPECFE